MCVFVYCLVRRILKMRCLINRRQYIDNVSPIVGLPFTPFLPPPSAMHTRTHTYTHTHTWSVQRSQHYIGYKYRDMVKSQSNATAQFSIIIGTRLLPMNTNLSYNH